MRRQRPFRWPGRILRNGLPGRRTNWTGKAIFSKMNHTYKEE
ncbi:hypothetical protein CLOM621_07408 [Clostridium sp. M62/1]|nr:hypothetical protein CLOM621_07408 [Clostridium sp. M62/1]